jgi:hypothetical protein
VSDHPYCYPGADVYRNELDIRDNDELDRAERIAIAFAVPGLVISEIIRLNAAESRRMSEAMPTRASPRNGSVKRRGAILRRSGPSDRHHSIRPRGFLVRRRNPSSLRHHFITHIASANPAASIPIPPRVKSHPASCYLSSGRDLEP